jgi:hypothetical protein
MTPRLTAVAANVALLEQGLEALRAIGPDRYRAPGRHPGTAGVGAHFRHVLDHYEAFFAGLARGRIDYDERRRIPQLAADAALAGAAARTWIGRLQELGAIPPRTDTVVVKAVESPHADPGGADPGGMEWVFSSVTRELGFLMSHTIHHYALIALVAKDLDVELDATFGVAPSTIAYRKRAAGCAR